MDRDLIDRAKRGDRDAFTALGLRLITDPDIGPATDDSHLTIELRDQLERAFRRLTADQRAVVVLHHYVGLSGVEIADALAFRPALFGRGCITPGKKCGRLSKPMPALSPMEASHEPADPSRPSVRRMVG